MSARVSRIGLLALVLSLPALAARAQHGDEKHETAHAAPPAATHGKPAPAKAAPAPAAHGAEPSHGAPAAKEAAKPEPARGKAAAGHGADTKAEPAHGKAPAAHGAEDKAGAHDNAKDGPTVVAAPSGGNLKAALERINQQITGPREPRDAPRRGAPAVARGEAPRIKVLWPPPLPVVWPSELGGAGEPSDQPPVLDGQRIILIWR